MDLSEKKNIILITLECLRADRISILGYKKKTTPNLDKIFKEGILFSRAYSVSSWTAPAINALLTSTYPFMYDGDITMNKRLSLAEVLKDNGYTTIGITFHPYLSFLFGYDKGFDVFKDGITEKGKAKRSMFSSLKYEVLRCVRTIFFKLEKKCKKIHILYRGWIIIKILRILVQYTRMTLSDFPELGEKINREILHHLKDTQQPFFVWAHYSDTHIPFLPPKKFSSDVGTLSKVMINVKARAAMFEHREDTFRPNDLEKYSDLFDMEVKYLDFCIKNLINELDHLGFLENTYIIITADHGMQFLEHGRIHNSIELYQELVHVPVFVTGPAIPHSVVTHLVSHIDIPPTILWLLSIDKPKTFVGENILDSNRIRPGVFCEEGQTERGEAFQKEPGTIKLDKENMKIAYITQDRSYIFRNNGEDELYDLIKDPMEKNNIINEEKETAEKLLKRIKMHLEEISSRKEEEEIININRAIKKLRSYGKV